MDRFEELDEYFDEPLPWMTLQPEVPYHWEGVIREVIVDLDPEVLGSHTARFHRPSRFIKFINYVDTGLPRLQVIINMSSTSR